MLMANYMQTSCNIACREECWTQLVINNPISVVFFQIPKGIPFNKFHCPRFEAKTTPFSEFFRMSLGTSLNGIEHTRPFHCSPSLPNDVIND